MCHISMVYYIYEYDEWHIIQDKPHQNSHEIGVWWGDVTWLLANLLKYLKTGRAANAAVHPTARGSNQACILCSPPHLWGNQAEQKQNDAQFFWVIEFWSQKKYMFWQSKILSILYNHGTNLCILLQFIKQKDIWGPYVCWKIGSLLQFTVGRNYFVDYFNGGQWCT